MSSPQQLYLLAAHAEIPDERLSIETVRERESGRFAEQLLALPAALRQRMEHGLGIRHIRIFRGAPSELGIRAAREVVQQAQVDPRSLDLIIDFSTLPGDRPGLWSLAHAVQADLKADRAQSLSVSGGGCAGLHIALRVAQALLSQAGRPGTALLVASDCARHYGRASLPISVMGDAASAAVLASAPEPPAGACRVASLQTTTLGMLQDVVTLRGEPPRISVDTHAFVRQVLPIHFVMVNRLLGRALAEVQITIEDLEWVSYPNTTDLDRGGVARALGFPNSLLSGPGPSDLGHAFGSDLIINCPSPLFSLPAPQGHASARHAALIAVGSGFTWGVCILESRAR